MMNYSKLSRCLLTPAWMASLDLKYAYLLVRIQDNHHKFLALSCWGKFSSLVFLSAYEAGEPHKERGDQHPGTYRRPGIVEPGHRRAGRPSPSSRCWICYSIGRSSLLYRPPHSPCSVAPNTIRRTRAGDKSTGLASPGKLPT